MGWSVYLVLDWGVYLVLNWRAYLVLNWSVYLARDDVTAVSSTSAHLPPSGFPCVLAPAVLVSTSRVGANYDTTIR
jgi:hypothetical protein